MNQSDGSASVTEQTYTRQRVAVYCDEFKSREQKQLKVEAEYMTAETQ